MSENVHSTGTMVPLSRHLTREEREDWGEILYDQGSKVCFNYDGTIAYTDHRDQDEYGIYFGDMHDTNLEEFKDLDQFGIGVLEHQARPYRCFWYNGADSDMGTITLDEFLESTSQNKTE